MTFPNIRSFGMDLSTRASRLLHKCRENDNILRGLISKASSDMVEVWYQWFRNFLCRLEVLAAELRRLFRHKLGRMLETHFSSDC